MAMGLPALVSNVGGLPENVRDGQEGWVVPAGNVDALLAVLHEMLLQPESLLSRGKSGRVRAEQVFSEAVLVQNTQKVYQQTRHVTASI